jgi:alpha,alpha-trehalase
VLRAAAALTSPGTGFSDCAALADAIMAETARTSAHPDGYWQRAPDDLRPDAALLLPPVRGAVPAADPRTTATLRVVRDRLAREEYVYRFRHDQRQLRGNLPQAFVHALLLECAATLET